MGVFDLTERVVLVTGGTRGIGLAIAKGMQQAGAHVWIHGSTQESTQKAAEENGFAYIYGDLRYPEHLNQILAPFLESEEKLDVLVNNAGFETHSQILSASEEEMDMIYNVNTKAPFFLTQMLIPRLKKSGHGSVINVTSIHQKVPVRENSYYCMSKASLSMFSKIAALELAKENIRVNNLAPGAILTDMNRELVEQMDFDKWIPMQRVGNVGELVGPAIFLASDAASYVTGTTLYVDGGYSENLLRY